MLRCLGGGNISRIDQVTYGNVALDLYLTTRENKYKQFADVLFEKLDSIDKADGLIIYNKAIEEQRIDGIGFVCYFLYYYSEVFGTPCGADLADKTIMHYQKWGVDAYNGIPAKAYSMNSHIKHVSPNWGRGISWYLQGLKKSRIDSREISLLDSTIMSNSYICPQYYDEAGVPDMTCTIPILCYLVEKGLINLTKEDFLHIVSPYCDKEGIIRFCSPIISERREGDKLSTNIFVQGMMLYLLSVLK